MSINRTWLLAFHAVASAGSFSRAATNRSISQSTLSAQVSALEKAYSVRLFDRSTRRVALTTIGERLLVSTEKMVAAQHGAEETLSGAHDLEKGALRLGADRPTLAAQLMTRFSEDHPAIQMSFRVGNSTELETAVEDQRLDVAIVGRPISSSRLRTKFLIDESVYAIIGKKHALARQKSVSFHRLAEHTLIVRENGSRLRELIDESLLELGELNSRLVEVNDWQAAREFAALNAGAAIVPKSEVVPDPRLVVLKLHGAMKSLPAYLVFRPEQMSHKIIGTFIEMTAADQSN